MINLTQSSGRDRMRGSYDNSADSIKCVADMYNIYAFIIFLSFGELVFFFWTKKRVEGTE